MCTMLCFLQLSDGGVSVPRINIMAAMMENRGIGKDGGLPWPHIKYVPEDTRRNNDVKTTSPRRFDVLMTLLLRRVSTSGHMT